MVSVEACFLSPYSRIPAFSSQELVCIGVGMDRPAIEALLDNCLLTDTEMDAYKVENFTRPSVHT